MTSDADRERQEEAWQSLFDSVKGQGLHSPPPGTGGPESLAAGPVIAVLGETKTDAQAAPAAGAPALVFQPRERTYEDDDAQIQKTSGRMWLVSFCDLISLMLCFFVLMYAMREPDMDKLTAMMGGGKGTYAGASETPQGEAGGDQAAESINRVEYGEALNLDYLQGVLKNALDQARLAGDVQIVNGRDHLKLVVDDPFGRGAALNADGVRIAKGLAERLNFLSNRITVVAHGGDWNDVVAQATAFGETMRDGGYRKNFTVIGEIRRGPAIEIRVEADDGQIR